MACQVGARRVQSEILGFWSAETYDAGCYNPLSFFDGTNTPSDHGRGEAIDIGIEPAYRGRNSVGQTIFLWLHANRARLGITQLIYDGQIWSAFNQPHLIRPYTANLHRDHIHASFESSHAQNPNLTAHPISALPTQPTQEVDVLSTDDKAQLVATRQLAQGAYEAALRAEANSLRSTTLLEKEVLPRARKTLMQLTGRTGSVRRIQEQVQAHNDLTELRLAEIDAELDKINR